MKKTEYNEGINEFSVVINNKEYKDIITIKNGMRNGISIMHKHTNQIHGELLHIGKIRAGSLHLIHDKNNTFIIDAIKRIEGVIIKTTMFEDDKMGESVYSIEIDGVYHKYMIDYRYYNVDYNENIQPEICFYPDFYYVQYPLTFK